MPLGDRQPLHSGELMTAGGVGDLQGADILLVAADHLKRTKICKKNKTRKGGG